MSEKRRQTRYGLARNTLSMIFRSGAQSGKALERREKKNTKNNQSQNLGSRNMDEIISIIRLYTDRVVIEKSMNYKCDAVTRVYWYIITINQALRVYNQAVSSDHN